MVLSFFLAIFLFANAGFYVSAAQPQQTTLKQASSDDMNPDTLKYPSNIKGLEKTAYYMVYETLNFDLGSKMKDIISGKSTTKVLSSMKKIYTNLIPIGEAMVVMFFLIELMDKTTKETFNLEQFFRMMLKLLFAKFLMENGWTLMESFMKIGNSVYSTALSSGGSGSSVSATKKVLEQYAKDIDDAGITGEIAIIIQWMIPFIFSYVTKLIAFVICWARTIEIGIRSAGAPIGMADMFADGLHGNGFRYLKKYFAVCMQAFVIMLIIYVSGIVQSSILGNGGVTAVSSVIIGLTTLSLLIKSQQYANDLIGA